MSRLRNHFTSLFLFLTVRRFHPNQMTSNQKSQVINALSEERVSGVKSVFLAGTTTVIGDSNWRQRLSKSLSKYPITIFNPNRPDWDST